MIKHAEIATDGDTWTKFANMLGQEKNKFSGLYTISGDFRDLFSKKIFLVAILGIFIFSHTY